MVSHYGNDETMVSSLVCEVFSISSKLNWFQKSLKCETSWVYSCRRSSTIRLLFLVTQCAYLRLIGEYVQIGWDFDDFGNGVNKRITGHFAIFREENIWSNVYFLFATAVFSENAETLEFIVCFELWGSNLLRIY